MHVTNKNILNKNFSEECGQFKILVVVHTAASVSTVPGSITSVKVIQCTREFSVL
jgi:hypothetical protein